MYENIFNNSIIEVEKETTEVELKTLREAYPNSIILREDSEFLKLLYSKLNSTNKFNELRNYMDNFSNKENIKIENINKFEKINYGKYVNYYINFLDSKAENSYAGNSEYSLEKEIKYA